MLQLEENTRRNNQCLTDFSFVARLVHAFRTPASLPFSLLLKATKPGGFYLQSRRARRIDSGRRIELESEVKFIPRSKDWLNPFDLGQSFWRIDWVRDKAWIDWVNPSAKDWQNIKRERPSAKDGPRRRKSIQSRPSAKDISIPAWLIQWENQSQRERLTKREGLIQSEGLTNFFEKDWVRRFDKAFLLKFFLPGISISDWGTLRSVKFKGKKKVAKEKNPVFLRDREAVDIAENRKPKIGSRSSKPPSRRQIP